MPISKSEAFNRFDDVVEASTEVAALLALFPERGMRSWRVDSPAE
jgi:hypothetical protein